MRIGIYTLPLNYNYGGLLQAYALQTVLERLGNQVVVLDRDLHPREPFWSRPREKAKRVVRKYVLRQPGVRVFLENEEAKAYPIISQNTRHFIEQHIHSVMVYDSHRLKNADFDALVVGSDQIWRCAFHDTKRKLYDAYLEFAKNWKVRRVAYAASLGTDKWEYNAEKTERCRQLIQKFDAVSVRESSGVGLIKDHFGVEATHVLDPTMLLTEKDYEPLFLGKTEKSDGKLMSYILDDTEEKRKIVDKVSAQIGLNTFIVNAQADNTSLPIEERIQPPVEQWLRGFYDADFVVTDSFHACVFSILFGKPFLAIGNSNRGMSRFESLLLMLNLQDRLVDASKGGSIEMPNTNLAKAQAILKEKKELSLDFLTKALSLWN